MYIYTRRKHVISGGSVGPLREQRFGVRQPGAVKTLDGLFHLDGFSEIVCKTRNDLYPKRLLEGISKPTTR